jgi:membrane-associated phospholipid phosphatase
MDPGAGFLFDESMIRWLQQAVGTDVPLPFQLASMLGDTWGILLAVGIARWVYGREPAVAVALAGGLAAPVWLGLAALFDVARPSGPGIVVFEQLDAGAFPSGHVFHAVIVWGVLAALTRLPFWTALLAGLVTGVGRVYLGMHYPADILASLALGPFFVWVFLVLRKRLPIDGASWSGKGWTSVSLAVALTLTLLLVGPVDPARLRRWEVFGLVYGGPAALGLHFVWERATTRVSGPTAVLLGLGGLLALAFLARTATYAPWIATVATAAALAWVFAGVPALASLDPAGRADRSA